MEAFLRELGRRGDVAGAHRELVEAHGEALVSDLVRARVLMRSPLRDGDRYPCEHNHDDDCPRIIAGDPAEGGAVAWCGSSYGCERVPIPPEEGFAYHVEPLLFGQALRHVLGLDGPALVAPGWRKPLVLGRRRMGEEEVSFILVRSSRLDHGRQLLLAAQSATPLLVLLAAHRTAIPPTTLPRVAGKDFLWLGLDQVLRLEQGRLTADLSTLALMHPFRGLDLGRVLWPRYELVLDPARSRFHWRGQSLDLGRNARVARLLLKLATQANTRVPRIDLQLDQWPEEFSARSGVSVNTVKLDRRLRDLKRVLVAALEATGMGPVPLEAYDSRSEDEGGYRLLIDPDRIHWVSAADL